MFDSNARPFEVKILSNNLGNEFLKKPQKLPKSPANGVARARSATEAFLYRRLQTLSGTRGRFELNANVPIPFDGLSQMEVDFLCEHFRIAFEVDGPQHLSDPETYRRDRRKDRLLQQNGYLVLRFLAEDAVKDLGSVLDSILQSLTGRAR